MTLKAKIIKGYFCDGNKDRLCNSCESEVKIYNADKVIKKLMQFTLPLIAIEQLAILN